MTGHTGKLRHCDTQGGDTGVLAGTVHKGQAQQANSAAPAGGGTVRVRIGRQWRAPSILEGLPLVPSRRRDRRV